MSGTRADWALLTDAQLLAQCEVDTYRASGPGGQKRNKTSSAVRLRHLPSTLIVIAEESRSQHENKAKALRRLRQRIWLTLRELPSAAFQGTDPTLAAPEPVDLNLGKRDVRFWPTAALVLDLLHFTKAQVSSTASLLGCSTGNLIDFLQTEEHLWTEANLIRQEYGQKPLKFS